MALPQAHPTASPHTSHSFETVQFVENTKGTCFVPVVTKSKDTCPTTVSLRGCHSDQGQIKGPSVEGTYSLDNRGHSGSNPAVAMQNCDNPHDNYSMSKNYSQNRNSPNHLQIQDLRDNQAVVYHEAHTARVKLEALSPSKDCGAGSGQTSNSDMMNCQDSSPRAACKPVTSSPSQGGTNPNQVVQQVEELFGEGEEGLRYLHDKFKGDKDMMQKLNTASDCFAAAGISRKEMDEYLRQLAKHIAMAPPESLNKSPQRSPPTCSVHVSPEKTEAYKCDLCDEKSYASLYHLRRHQRTHGEVRPYECNVCPKAFYDLNKLKRHCLIHTGVKPYECHLCDKKVSRPEHLRRHLLTHSELRPYKCGICDFSARRNDSVRSHIKSKHPDAPLLIINMNELLGFSPSDDVQTDIVGQSPKSSHMDNTEKSKKSPSKSKKKSRSATGEADSSPSLKSVRYSNGKTLQPSQESAMNKSPTGYPPWPGSSQGQPASPTLSTTGSPATAFSVPYTTHGLLPTTAVVSSSHFPNLQMTVGQGNYLPGVRIPPGGLVTGASPYFYESQNEAALRVHINGPQHKPQTSK